MKELLPAAIATALLLASYAGSARLLGVLPRWEPHQWLMIALQLVIIFLIVLK